MATRAYRRDKNGRFAGSGGGGTTITYGKAGGFANSAFRARVAASRGANLQKPANASQRASSSRSLGATVGAASRSQAGRVARAAGRGALNVAVTQATVNAVGRSFGRPASEARLGNITRAALFASGVSTSLNNTRPSNPAGRKVKR